MIDNEQIIIDTLYEWERELTDGEGFPQDSMVVEQIAREIADKIDVAEIMGRWEL